MLQRKLYSRSKQGLIVRQRKCRYLVQDVLAPNLSPACGMRYLCEAPSALKAMISTEPCEIG